jgi:hypothetical protein
MVRGRFRSSLRTGRIMGMSIGTFELGREQALAGKENARRVFDDHIWSESPYLPAVFSFHLATHPFLFPVLTFRLFPALGHAAIGCWHCERPVLATGHFQTDPLPFFQLISLLEKPSIRDSADSLIGHILRSMSFG